MAHFNYMTFGADLYGTSPEVTVEAWANHGSCKVSMARFMIDRKDLNRIGPMGAARELDWDQIERIMKEQYGITYSYAEAQLHYPN